MGVKLPIYLDSHATTPCDPRVIEAMLPCFGEKFGNAASRNHSFGWEAEALVENAREQVARLIGANPQEIIFTSGATESDNLALKGTARAYAEKGTHIVTSALEHSAVLDSCRSLETEGFQVTYLPASSGAESTQSESSAPVQPGSILSALGPGTILVSIMFANNEIGTINPIAEIGRICKDRKVIFHCDAVQAMAYLPCDVESLGVDLLSISAHKMYGPKGIGALYVRRRNPRVRLEPIIHGGGHERGLRSGTLNVPGIVGLGKACEIVMAERENDARRIGALRDRLLQSIVAGVPDAVVNGPLSPRLPNNLNLSFPGVESEALMLALRDVAVSTGAACTSADLEPSHVLKGIGVSDELAHGSIRFGLHRFTTQEEIDYVAGDVVTHVRRLRAASFAS